MHKEERCTRRTTLHPGVRPGVPSDPGPPWVEAAAVGYVAAGVPLLGAPSLAASSAEAIDGRTLSFLLQRALDDKRKEKKEAKLVAEVNELEEKLAVAEGKLLVELQREWEQATRISRQTCMGRALPCGAGRLPWSGTWPRTLWRRGRGGRGGHAGAGLGSYSATLHDVSYDSLFFCPRCSMSLGWFYRPLYLAVTCLTLVFPEEYVCRFYWEMTSGGFRFLLLLVRQWIHVASVYGGPRCSAAWSV